jgi:hypothetical protein
MITYWIITTGQGILPVGRKVGFIEAASPEEPEDALIRAGQIPPRLKRHFMFALKSVR